MLMDQLLVDFKVSTDQLQHISIEQLMFFDLLLQVHHPKQLRSIDELSFDFAWLDFDLADFQTTALIEDQDLHFIMEGTHF